MRMQRMRRMPHVLGVLGAPRRVRSALCAPLVLVALAQLAACDLSSLPDGSGDLAVPAPSASATASPPPMPTAMSGSTITNLDYAMRVIARTNWYRAQFGCPALVPNGILMGTALAHSADMALHHKLQHPSSDGTPPWTRIKASGYAWRIVAENIASATVLPEQVVDQWFDETPPNDAHRANILNCALRDVGVGYYTIWEPSWHTNHPYWTEDFGTPSA
jgi:uncharacterized protein YkwD